MLFITKNLICCHYWQVIELWCCGKKSRVLLLLDLKNFVCCFCTKQVTQSGCDLRAPTLFCNNVLMGHLVLQRDGQGIAHQVCFVVSAMLLLHCPNWLLVLHSCLQKNSSGLRLPVKRTFSSKAIVLSHCIHLLLSFLWLMCVNNSDERIPESLILLLFCTCKYSRRVFYCTSS